MGNSSSLTVIIPVLNEEDGIKKLGPALAGRQVLLVDGGSTDETLKIASKFSFKVVSEPRLGYGRAYKTALRHVKTEYIACFDGDGTYSTQDIGPALRLAARGGADAVFGNRFGYPANVVKLHRRIGNMAITMFINLLFGCRFEDSQSGFWVMRTSAARAHLPASDGMPFSQELKIRLTASGLDTRWIPVHYIDRPSKGSKFNFFIDGFRLLTSALSLRLGNGGLLRGR